MLQVQAFSTDELRPYERNPRRGAVQAIAESLAARGQYRPIVVNVGTLTGRPLEVLAGNHTLAAAVALGWASIEATTVDVDDAEAARIVLADNRLADLGSYDDVDLAAVLARTDGVLDGTGFTDADLAELLAGLDTPAGLTDPDDVPPLPVTPRSKVGDVWTLGPHRLVCGSALDPEVWATLLGDEQADMVWTDPPYGVSVVGGNRMLPVGRRRAEGHLELENDDLDPDGFLEFLHSAFGEILTHTRPGAVWFVCAPSGVQFLQFAQAMTDVGVWRHTMIWVKDTFVLGRADYHYRHEAIFYGWTPGGPHHKQLDRTSDTVYEVPRPTRSTEHPTMKPVALITPGLSGHTRPGERVADPFAGSGATLIAAHDTGRIARLIELEPKYVDVICRRYEEHTGIVPVRDGEEVSFR